MIAAQIRTTAGHRLAQAARHDQCGFGLTAGEAAARVVVFDLVRDIAGPFERRTAAGAIVVLTAITDSPTARRWTSVVQRMPSHARDEWGSVDGPRCQPCGPASDTAEGSRKTENQQDETSVVPRGGIEPPTHGFSVRCSTN